MTLDDVIQEVGSKIYEHPLSMIRSEADFQNLANPLHLIVLLLDCDTEIMMNGMLGFLENMTGRHLLPTIEALRQIGAPAVAGRLQAVHDCMTRYGVTWQQLRGDFEGGQQYEITSFRKLHGSQLDSFASEVSTLGHGFSLFRTESGEAPYEALCTYMEGRLTELRGEIDKRQAQPSATPNSRPPSRFPVPPEIPAPDPLRSPSPGGCG